MGEKARGGATLLKKRGRLPVVLNRGLLELGVDWRGTSSLQREVSGLVTLVRGGGGR
jgi:hypothetical protein